ncbi:MAG: hypothetical protein WBW77_08060, partial [Candidatus Sulfotelmatobacter sp.]
GIPFAPPHFLGTLSPADFSLAACALRRVLQAGLSFAVCASEGTAAGTRQKGADPGTAHQS